MVRIIQNYTGQKSHSVGIKLHNANIHVQEDKAIKLHDAKISPQADCSIDTHIQQNEQKKEI